mgnify:CR=1 FL=1
MSAVYENQASDFYCRGGKNYKSKLQCSPHLHYHIEFVQLLEGETVGYADTEDENILEARKLYAERMEAHKAITSAEAEKVKAAGGIRDLAALEAFVEAGADRIGTSNGVEIVSQAK